MLCSYATGLMWFSCWAKSPLTLCSQPKQSSLPTTPFQAGALSLPLSFALLSAAGLCQALIAEMGPKHQGAVANKAQGLN